MRAFSCCALQCQSTHCNLPNVAAIYAIKHVFNIPEPHCVCVFLALSLTHRLALSHSHSISMCVCVCVCGPHRAADFSPIAGGSSLAQRHGQQEVGVYIGLVQPEKSRLSGGAAAPSLLLLSPLHSPLPAYCPIPPPPQLSHPRLLV